MSTDSMNRKKKKEAVNGIDQERPKSPKKAKEREENPERVKAKERVRRKEVGDGGRNGNGALPLAIESR